MLFDEVKIWVDRVVNWTGLGHYQAKTDEFNL